MRNRVLSELDTTAFIGFFFSRSGISVVFASKITLFLSFAKFFREKISTQTSKETQTQIAVKRGMLKKIQIELPEESQSQVAEESEIFVSGNTRSPSPNETRTLTEEGTETHVTAETQIPSPEETKTRAAKATETGVTGVSKIPSVEKTQTQATTESTNLGKDETRLQHPEETYTRANTAGYKSTLATEDTDIKFPDIYQTKTAEDRKLSIVNGKDIYFYCIAKKIPLLLTLLSASKESFPPPPIF